MSSANKVVWLELAHAGGLTPGVAAEPSKELWATRGWTTKPATGAIAGKPGSWTPAGAMPPATVAAIGSAVASPASAWTKGQYVQTDTPGAAGKAHWGGSSWVAGVTP